MKKKHLKALREAAAEMKVVNEVKGYVKENIAGNKLTPDQIKDLEEKGIDYDPKGNYTRKTQIIAPVNYYRKLKKYMKEKKVFITKKLPEKKEVVQPTKKEVVLNELPNTEGGKQF